jgi:beta-1,4-mannosyl-glycoprotein beta-1,4-N-acetylglucosaminyltransferase
MTLNIARRPARNALLAIIFLIGCIIFFLSGRKHEVQPELFNVGTGTPRPLDAQEAASLCKAHGFSPYKGSRKIYDMFLFHQELDWLEIRLNTLSPYVDYFVIVEGKTTFTNMAKPAVLEVEENWENVTAFRNQVMYHALEDPINSQRSWDHEDFYRDGLLKETFPHYAGKPQQLNYGDVLIVADIDEVPKPETVMLLRYCNFPSRLTIRSHFYYYSYQWEHRGSQWAHPQVTYYRGPDNTITPNNLRHGDEGPRWPLPLFFMRPIARWFQKADLFSATWHCSSCFSTLKEMRSKMESFSHSKWNTPENREPKTIVERVRHGLDLFNRWGENYDKIEDNQDVPRYILTNRERYHYMLNRDDEDAAFADLTDFGL